MPTSASSARIFKYVFNIKLNILALIYSSLAETKPKIIVFAMKNSTILLGKIASISPF